MKALLIIIMLFAHLVKANDQILLVANKNTPLHDYKTICQKNGYLCLPAGFNQIITRKTDNYDLLIEGFDLDDKIYIKSYYEQLTLTLKNDDLSADQFKNLILATEKIQLHTKSLQLSDSLKLLKKLYSTLTSIPEDPSDRIIYIAGKMIPNTARNKILLEPYFAHIKFTEIDYISVTTNKDKKYFLNGSCEYPRYAEFISQLTMQVVPHFPEGCDLSLRYKWGTDLIKSHFSENKNIYLVGVTALAAAWLLKNYEISNDH